MNHAGAASSFLEQRSIWRARRSCSRVDLSHGRARGISTGTTPHSPRATRLFEDRASAYRGKARVAFRCADPVACASARSLIKTKREMFDRLHQRLKRLSDEMEQVIGLGSQGLVIVGLIQRGQVGSGKATPRERVILKSLERGGNAVNAPRRPVSTFGHTMGTKTSIQSSGLCRISLSKDRKMPLPVVCDDGMIEDGARRVLIWLNRAGPVAKGLERHGIR